MHPNTNPSALSRRDALRLLGFTGVIAALPSLVARAADPAPAPAPIPPTPAGGPPSLAGTQPGFYRFRIGDFEALALNDGGFGGPLDQSPWPSAPREALAATLTAAFLPADRFALPFNVLLVRMGSELVLIDSGAGTVFGPAGGRLPARLAAAGVKPEQITAVFLSHAHGDHFGGLLDAQMQPAFKNARHFMGRREWDYWTGPVPADPQKQASFKGAQTYLKALEKKWQFIAPGDPLLSGLEIVEAYGHTPGHLAFRFTSGNDQLLHLVDTAHHHAVSFGHPEWVLGFDVEPQVAIATRQKILDRVAADRTRIFAAHVPFPGLGHLRRAGAGFEYVIEPWSVD